MKDSITNDRIKKYGMRIFAAVFWIGIWQIASKWLGQEILLASPVSVMQKLGNLVMIVDFWKSIWFSFARIVLGFLLALILGAGAAVLSSCLKVVRILLAPLITVIKSTPVASFIILCLIWIPSRNLSVFISFLMVLPVVYTNLLEGIGQTDRKLLEMADVFGVGPAKKICYIYLSQILPYLLTACRLALGLCWKAGVAAEVIGVPSGSIGEKLYHAKIYLNTPDLFAWTIVIIVISFLFEKCFLAGLTWLVKCVERR
ncbi:ABC transporter permease subunit [Roseburia hominis]